MPIASVWNFLRMPYVPARNIPAPERKVRMIRTVEEIRFFSMEYFRKKPMPQSRTITPARISQVVAAAYSTETSSRILPTQNHRQKDFKTDSFGGKSSSNDGFSVTFSASTTDISAGSSGIDGQITAGSSVVSESFFSISSMRQSFCRIET